MKQLLEDIRTLVRQGPVDAAGIHTVQDSTLRALPQLAKQVASREYEPGRYLIYKDQDFGFVMMMLVWNHGQVTPIHDHGTWGIEAVVKNKVRVTNFTRCNNQPKELGSVVLPEGAVAYVMPPDADVHQVAHYGSGQTITIHIYGQELLQSQVFVPGKGFCPQSLVCKSLKFDFDLRDRQLQSLDFQI